MDGVIRHQHQQCENNRKGNQIHHSSDYHSLHIVHSTCKIGMIASEKVYRNIISDHIIGRHKQQNDHEKCNHDLAFKFADHLVYSLFHKYPATKNGKNTTILEADKNVLNSILVPAHTQK